MAARGEAGGIRAPERTEVVMAGADVNVEVVIGGGRSDPFAVDSPVDGGPGTRRKQPVVLDQINNRLAILRGGERVRAFARDLKGALPGAATLRNRFRR